MVGGLALRPRTHFLWQLLGHGPEAVRAWLAWSSRQLSSLPFTEACAISELASSVCADACVWMLATPRRACKRPRAEDKYNSMLLVNGYDARPALSCCSSRQTAASTGQAATSATSECMTTPSLTRWQMPDSRNRPKNAQSKHQLQAQVSKGFCARLQNRTPSAMLQHHVAGM